MSRGADPVVSSPDVELLGRLREEGGAVLRAVPVMRRLEVLGRAGARLNDPDDPLTREVLTRIPGESGLSPSMAAAVVRGMARDWTRERLEVLLAADLPDPTMLDRFVAFPPGSGDAVRAIPDGLALHIGSGSVPGVSATSLVRSLLVGTPTLIKPGAGDRALTEAMARAVVLEEPAWAEALAVSWWPGGKDPFEPVALSSVDRVVVYGSDETVARVRGAARPGCPVVAYPNRVSVGLLGRERLGTGTLQTLVHQVAGAASLYDQRGCVSPQSLWVEEGGETSVEDFAEALAAEMARWEASHPAATPDVQAAARIRNLREAADLHQAVEEAEERGLVASNRTLGFWPEDGSAGWTVLLDPGRQLGGGGPGRILTLYPVEDLERDAIPEIARLGDALQSVALEVAGPRRADLAHALARVGCTRITTFQRQPWPPAWWRHDGQGPLSVLVRWVSLEE